MASVSSLLTKAAFAQIKNAKENFLKSRRQVVARKKQNEHETSSVHFHLIRKQQTFSLFFHAVEQNTIVAKKYFMGCASSQMSETSSTNTNLPRKDNKPSNQSHTKNDQHHNGTPNRFSHLPYGSPVGYDEQQGRHPKGGVHNKKCPIAAGHDDPPEQPTVHRNQPARTTERDNQSEKRSVHQDDQRKFFEEYGRTSKNSGQFHDGRRRSPNEADPVVQVGRPQDRFDNRHGRFPDGADQIEPVGRHQGRFPSPGQLPNADQQLVPRGRFDDTTEAEEREYRLHLFPSLVEEEHRLN